MSPLRSAAVLGPLIVLVLLAGVVTAILRGAGDDDVAQRDGQTETPATEEPATRPPLTESPSPEVTGQPFPGATEPGPTQPGPTQPGPAEPAPAEAPGAAEGEPGAEIAAVTGGWVGGLPNTGTSVQAVGLPLLLLGGLLLVLRQRA